MNQYAEHCVQAWFCPPSQKDGKCTRKVKESSEPLHIRHKGEGGTFRAPPRGWAKAGQNVIPQARVKIRPSDSNQDFITLDSESPRTIDCWRLTDYSGGKSLYPPPAHTHSAVSICHCRRHRTQPRTAILTLHCYHEKRRKRGGSWEQDSVLWLGMASAGLHIGWRSQNHLNKVACFPDGKDCLYPALVQ